MNVTLCFGQPIPLNKNQTLICKETATWCGPCGSWGWDLQELLEADNKDKALVIALHVWNSDLDNAITTAWEQNFTATNGIPCWYASGIDKTEWAKNSGGVSPYAIRKAINDEVNKFNSAQVKANSSFKYTFKNDSLYTSCTSKFFQNLTGEYYLGVYLLEDSVLNKQNTDNGIVQKYHLNVLRASIDNSPFGTLLAKGSIASGKQYSTNFNSYYLDPKKVNFKKAFIATIIWKKENGKYYLINTNKTNEYIQKSINTAVINENKELQIKIYPSPIISAGLLLIKSPNKYDHAEIGIYDINGNLLKHQYVDIQPELNSIELETCNLESGSYFIKIKTGNSFISERFIKLNK